MLLDFDATFVGRSEPEGLRNVCGAQTFSVSNGRLKLDCHSSCYFVLLGVIRTSFLELVRHFALGLEFLKTNPEVAMLKTNWYQKWMTTLEQQEVRNCPFRFPFPSLVWLAVVVDR